MISGRRSLIRVCGCSAQGILVAIGKIPADLGMDASRIRKYPGRAKRGNIRGLCVASTIQGRPQRLRCDEKKRRKKKKMRETREAVREAAARKGENPVTTSRSGCARGKSGGRILRLKSEVYVNRRASAGLGEYKREYVYVCVCVSVFASLSNY